MKFNMKFNRKARDMKKMKENRNYFSSLPENCKTVAMFYDGKFCKWLCFFHRISSWKEVRRVFLTVNIFKNGFLLLFAPHQLMEKEAGQVFLCPVLSALFMLAVFMRPFAFLFPVCSCLSVR